MVRTLTDVSDGSQMTQTFALAAVDKSNRLDTAKMTFGTDRINMESSIFLAFYRSCRCRLYTWNFIDRYVAAMNREVRAR